MNTYSLSIPSSLGILLVITITTVPEYNDKTHTHTHTHTHKEDLSFQLYTIYYVTTIGNQEENIDL